VDEKVKIENTDIWFKVVDFLQQNWGVIEVTPPGFTLYFLVTVQVYSIKLSISQWRRQKEHWFVMGFLDIEMI